MDDSLSVIELSSSVESNSSSVIELSVQSQNAPGNNPHNCKLEEINTPELGPESWKSDEKISEVDLETPNSIIVNSNLTSLLNEDTFSSLPPHYQHKLMQLLPLVDQVQSDSSLKNEYFARACLDWKERLAEGEITKENQAKLRAEEEEEKQKLDPWKLKHFEPMWGQSFLTQNAQDSNHLPTQNVDNSNI